MTKWWELPRVTVRGEFHMGDLVPDVECPFDQKRILYNGNYFCENFGYESRIFSDGKTYGERRGGPCDWALAHPATTKVDRKICDLIGIDYE